MMTYPTLQDLPEDVYPPAPQYSLARAVNTYPLLDHAHLRVVLQPQDYDKLRENIDQMFKTAIQFDGALENDSHLITHESLFKGMKEIIAREHTEDLSPEEIPAFFSYLKTCWIFIRSTAGLEMIESLTKKVTTH